MNKKFAVCILIILLCLFASCTNPKEKDFSDPSIIAYINDEPIYLTDKEDFTRIKTAYSEAVLKIDFGLEKIEEPEIMTYEDVQKLIDGLKPDILLRAEEYTFYSNIEKEQDYLRYIMRIYTYNKQMSKQEKEEFIEANESAFIPMNSGIYLGTESDYILWDSMIGVIKEIAEEKGMSYDECVESIYKPFWLTLTYYSYFTDEFWKEYYKGDGYIQIETNEGLLSSGSEEQISEYSKDIWEKVKKITIS